MKLYAIGVGPGDPELLTIKAQRILQQVSKVYVPRSGSRHSSVALHIAGRFIPEKVKIEFLHLPMLSREQLEPYWEQAAQQVVNGMQGDAAFLTLGDSLTYSTASYLLGTVSRLEPAVEVRYIPGITSFSACAARVGLPLTEGDESLVVVPSACTEQQLKSILTLHENCILMKVSRAFDLIVAVLEQMGLKRHAVFVSRCGTPQERLVFDLDTLKDEKIDYLSLLIIKRPKGGNEG